MAETQGNTAKRYRLGIRRPNDATEQVLRLGEVQAGQPFAVQVVPGALYRLIDERSQGQPAHLSLKRDGTALQAEVEGATVLSLQGFYALAGGEGDVTRQQGGQAIPASPVYVLDDTCATDPRVTPQTPEIRTLEADQRLIWSEDDGTAVCAIPVLPLEEPFTLMRAGVAAAGGAWATGLLTPETAPAAAVGNLVIHGSVFAGPVHGGLVLEAYDQTGFLLGSTTVNADGTYSIVAPRQGAYRGTVLLRVMDVNGAAGNYLDEVSATDRSLGTDLRAVGNAKEGDSHFVVNALDAELAINITPLTELAVRQVGLSGMAAPADPTAASAAAANVATAFGLAGLDLAGNVVTTNSAAFSAANGLSDSEKYGLVLAKLSGIDSLNGGNVGLSLQQFQQTLSGATLSVTGTALLDQGRSQALDALMTAPAGAQQTFLEDTPLNRQLLGDIVVGTQTLDGASLLTVTGTALPGSQLTITFPDGSKSVVAVDSSGAWSATSDMPQLHLLQPVTLAGTDALGAEVTARAPAAPLMTAAAAASVTGVGDPGSTVTLLDISNHVLATGIIVAPDGTWTATLPVPLTGGAQIIAMASNARGEPSASTQSSVDPGHMIVSVPEALDGFINAAEKASDGGVPITVSLASGASANDVVTTVVTRPGGATLTLTTTLSASDIAAGSIVQKIATSDLTPDGNWATSTQWTHGAQSSAAITSAFILQTTLPAPGTIDATNGNTVTGTAAPGLTVVLAAGGQTIGTTTTDVLGHWSVTPLAPLADGAVVTATVVDHAGNPGSGSVEAVVNVQAPVITSVLDDVGARHGLVFSAGRTDDTTPSPQGVLSAPLAAGEVLDIYRTNPDTTTALVGQASVNGTAWSISEASALAEGTYVYTAKVQSGSHALTTSAPFTLSVDLTALGAPTLFMAEAPGGVSAAEKLSAGGTPVDVGITPTGAMAGDTLTLVATSPSGDSITIIRVLTVADIAAGSVPFVLPTAFLAVDGSYGVSARVTDIAGHVGPNATTQFVVDTVDPASPTGHLTHDTPNDTGTSSTDNITSNTHPQLSGTAEPGATVDVTVHGKTYTTTADPTTGAWTVTIPATDALPDATYTPSIKATDAAGNSTTANGTPFTVDHPTISVVGQTITQVAAAVGTMVATFSTTDPAGLPVTVDFTGITNSEGYYTLGTGADAGNVLLTAAGVARLAAGFDLPAVDLTVSNGGLTAEGADVALVNYTLVSNLVSTPGAYVTGWTYGDQTFSSNAPGLVAANGYNVNAGLSLFDPAANPDGMLRAWSNAAGSLSIGGVAGYAAKGPANLSLQQGVTYDLSFDGYWGGDKNAAGNLTNNVWAGYFEWQLVEGTTIVQDLTGWYATTGAAGAAAPATYTLLSGANQYTPAIYQVSFTSTGVTASDYYLALAWYCGGQSATSSIYNGNPDGGRDAYIDKLYIAPTLVGDNVMSLAQAASQFGQATPSINGGDGNDVIRMEQGVSPGTVIGGAGLDALVMTGTGMTLDLTPSGLSTLKQVERVDLTGTGANTLKLDVSDVLQSSTNVWNAGNTTTVTGAGLGASVSKAQILVDGDASDKVTLTDLANWTTAGTVAYGSHTYTIYNSNTQAVQLLIDNHLTVASS